MTKCPPPCFLAVHVQAHFALFSPVMRPDVRPPKSRRADVITAMRRRNSAGGRGYAHSPADEDAARSAPSGSTRGIEGGGTGLRASDVDAQGLAVADTAGGVLEAFAAAELISLQAAGVAQQISAPSSPRETVTALTETKHGLLWQLSPGLFHAGNPAAPSEPRPSAEQDAAAEASDDVTSGEESRAAAPVERIRHAQSRLLQRGSQRSVLLPQSRTHLRDLVVRASSRSVMPRPPRVPQPTTLPLWKKLGCVIFCTRSAARDFNPALAAAHAG